MVRGPSAQEVLLEDLLSSVPDERDVCLVDEVRPFTLHPSAELYIESHLDGRRERSPVPRRGCVTPGGRLWRS